ncbi:MAG TPA: helix-turn-helix transcriptional regulator [Elusimicrobiota bacterium]|jgi:transcriptional regulator with XRE-family HTH domain|nr:helix-turn-helix transcriptional regulator [Elusimicrobiota bacterium]
MPNIYSLLGKRIRAERAARHLTQQELADAAGMDTAHLSRIEHGKAVPSINMVKKLADALGLPIGALFADIPAQKIPEYGWAGKMGAMVKEMSPKQRAKVLRVLKSIVGND